MKQRKYMQGELLSLEDAAARIATGRYIFWHNKPVHPGWAGSWQLRMLAASCQRGFIRDALINPNYVEKTK